MRFFADAQVSPVLTAHPTEVRRKSTMDREMEVAALLDRRERMKMTPEEADASDEQLRRAVLTLWQTNLLRRTKLTVLDEVENGLSFYDYTFLHEVPRLHCALEDQLSQEEGTSGELASFLTMGSWIGGDRDGNPFVTADVMRGTLHLQSSRVHRTSISSSCMPSAPSCRWPRISLTSPTSCGNLPDARLTTRRTAVASPIGWRFPASTPD